MQTEWGNINRLSLHWTIFKYASSDYAKIKPHLKKTNFIIKAISPPLINVLHKITQNHMMG